MSPSSIPDTPEQSSPSLDIGPTREASNIWIKCDVLCGEFRRGDSHERNRHYAGPVMQLQCLIFGDPRLSSGGCPLQRMPEEILVEIARYMIPTRWMFYIHPWKVDGEDNEMVPVTVVDRFMPARLLDLSISPKEKESSTLLNASAVASTCKRLRNVYYSVFYGENEFVFLVQSVPLYFGGKVRCGPDDRIECWSKTFQIQSRKDNLWPLTKTVLACHIRHLGFVMPSPPAREICGHLYSEDAVAKVLGLLPLKNTIKSVTVEVSDAAPQNSTFRPWCPRQRREDSSRCYEDEAGRINLASHSRFSRGDGAFERVRHAVNIAEALRGVEVILNGEQVQSYILS